MYQFQRDRPTKYNKTKENSVKIKVLDLKEILLIIVIFLLITNIITTSNSESKLSSEHKVLLNNVVGITSELKKDTIVMQPEIEYEEDETEATTEVPTESQEVETENSLFDVYSDFTPEEIYIIQRCVETETYGADIQSKMNVASVIFNRLYDYNNKYGDSVTDIITSPNQFAYWRTEISDTTIEAIEMVYRLGDTTNGCIAFRSDIHPEEWCGWKLQFVDDVGHGFYK